MRISKRMSLIFAALLSFTLVAAACGGDDDSSSNASDSSSSSEESISGSVSVSGSSTV